MLPLAAAATIVSTALAFATAQESTAGTFLIPGNSQVAPSCEGCFCVVSKGEECPSSMPQTDFDESHIERLKAARWETPISLDCNPYTNSSCYLMDASGNDVREQDCDLAVCGLRYTKQDEEEGVCPTSYSTKTFINMEELERDTEGYFLTHYGACGACSSTQDLAVYMQLQFENVGMECGALAITNETVAHECFQDAGFTPGCAAIWLYNTIYTRENCLSSCVSYLGKPPNQDLPGCPYNECIQCDEDFSGPIFRAMAGRSRRRSGLLSYIVQNCSHLFWDVAPTDPCPTNDTTTPTTGTRVEVGAMDEGSSSYSVSFVPRTLDSWGFLLVGLLLGTAIVTMDVL